MHITAPVAKGCVRNLLASAAMQIVLLLLGGLALDGGQLGQWVVYSISIYWVMAFLIIARRFSTPSKGDLIALRYGFIFILVSVALSTSISWSIRGH
jgi:hypothetical protein